MGWLREIWSEISYRWRCWQATRERNRQYGQIDVWEEDLDDDA